MKRRGFLGLVGAAVAAPFVPPATPSLAVASPLMTVNEVRAREGILVTPELLEDCAFDVTSFGPRQYVHVPPRGRRRST